MFTKETISEETTISEEITTAKEAATSEVTNLAINVDVIKEEESIIKPKDDEVSTVLDIVHTFSVNISQDSTITDEITSTTSQTRSCISSIMELHHGNEVMVSSYFLLLSLCVSSWTAKAAAASQP